MHFLLPLLIGFGTGILSAWGVGGGTLLLLCMTLFLGVAGSALPAAMAGLFTPLSAYCFLVFVLLYPPCAAAVATMRRELHSARLTLLMVIYQTGTAFLLAALIYRIGSILLPV